MARNARRSAGRSTPAARPEADADPDVAAEADETTGDQDAVVESAEADETLAADAESEDAGDVDDDEADDDAGDHDEADDDSVDADDSDDEDDADDADDSDDDEDSDDADDADDDGDDEDQRVLVGASAKAKGRSSRTGGKADADDARATRGTRSKGRATPRRRSRTQVERRNGVVEFLRESYSELRKVVYPSSKTLWTYFVVVLVFVVFVIGYVTLLDLGFGWVILKVFG